MLPLDGFRILDLTRFLSGPYCTMVLAELGAAVVKVEQPHTGDDSRRLAPKVNGESYPFGMPNRSKRSISLDLKTDRGRDLFLHLARDVDLVIENFRPGVVRRLGIDYESVRAVRPDVLYCSISGFGQTGPYRDRPGFDIMAQGAVGLMRMTGEPGGRPAKVGIAINDIAAGATATTRSSPRRSSAPAPAAGSTWTSRSSTRGSPGQCGSRVPTSPPARCRRPPAPGTGVPRHTRPTARPTGT